MDYPPVHTAHLQQIRQLNELFLNLVTHPGPQGTFAGLPAGAGGLLAEYGTVEQDELAALPRALFQIHLEQAPARPVTHQGVSSAVRAFTLTALLVAFNIVHESKFAARVLFKGSWSALDLLGRCQLGDLIDYSARRGLITCPLLKGHTPASRFLSSPRQGNGGLSRDALIALAQSQSPVCSAALESLQPDPAMVRVN